MKIFVISLGCPKNSIDTELVLGAIKSCKSDVHITAECEKADVILINTCGFIESAVSESIETVISAGLEKKSDQKLVVMGCMVERYREELASEMPEIDIFWGTGNPSLLGRNIVNACSAPYDTSELKTAYFVKDVKRANGGDEHIFSRFVTTPFWRAYVKISEGCSNRCTYCLIPGLRGENISRPVSGIVREVNALAEKGVREVTLVAQDLTSYLYENTDLADLLTILEKDTDVTWFRLLYLHPSGIGSRLLEVISESSSVLPYLDIPVQHASDRILRRMGRNYDTRSLEHLFSNIRKIIPEAAVRTTVMVGFPGESPEDFLILKNFIKKHRFRHMGCFVYSDEDDCVSYRFVNKVPGELAEERRKEIMEIQADISMELNSTMIGRTEDVLIEGISPETELLLTGRTVFQGHDIDGITYINSGNAIAGDIVPVKITSSHIYDLVGEIVDDDRITAENPYCDNH